MIDVSEVSAPKLTTASKVKLEELSSSEVPSGKLTAKYEARNKPVLQSQTSVTRRTDSSVSLRLANNESNFSIQFYNEVEKGETTLEPVGKEKWMIRELTSKFQRPRKLSLKPKDL